MEWREFIIRLIEAILSWPVAATVAVFILRGRILGLLEDASLKRAKFGNSELEWDVTARAALSGLAADPEAPSGDDQAEPEAPLPTVSDDTRTPSPPASKPIVRRVGRRYYGRARIQPGMRPIDLENRFRDLLEEAELTAVALGLAPADERIEDPLDRYDYLLGMLSEALTVETIDSLAEVGNLYSIARINGADPGEVVEFRALAELARQRLEFYRTRPDSEGNA